jgi:hypothetical protein
VNVAPHLSHRMRAKNPFLPILLIMVRFRLPLGRVASRCCDLISSVRHIYRDIAIGDSINNTLILIAQKNGPGQFDRQIGSCCNRQGAVSPHPVVFIPLVRAVLSAGRSFLPGPFCRCAPLAAVSASACYAPLAPTVVRSAPSVSRKKNIIIIIITVVRY